MDDASELSAPDAYIAALTFVQTYAETLSSNALEVLGFEMEVPEDAWDSDPAMLPPFMKQFGATAALKDVDEPAAAQLVDEIGGPSLATPNAAALRWFDLAEAARTKR